MNKRIIVAAIAAVIIIVAIPVGIGQYQQVQKVNSVKSIIAEPYKDNPVAQSIASKGIPVKIEQLGEDGNGYSVQGQTRTWTRNGVTVRIEVIIDSDVAPEDVTAILAHEEGHIVNPDGDEAYADNYAKEVWNQDITDAYHGIK